MLRLSARDNELLSGDSGAAAEFAMQAIIALGESCGAERLLDINWAHVASAYYQGPVSLDFARRLAQGNARVVVPTTLTACSLNLRDGAINAVDESAQRELIDLYTEMGCEPAMTCAPYQARPEPGFGDHLAWSESSAVVYANSVLGARSNRYVEFIDMCAALTGRVPDFGLHTTGARRATALFQLREIPGHWFDDDWFFHVLGILVGQQLLVTQRLRPLERGERAEVPDAAQVGCAPGRARRIAAARLRQSGLLDHADIGSWLRDIASAAQPRAQ